LPSKLCCDFKIIVDAAKPITPGLVQPSKGTILSVVPIATIIF